MNIGAVLATCRKGAGLSQQNIANYLHTNQPYISDIENGKAIPDIDEVIKWAEITNSRDVVGQYLTGDKDWEKTVKMKLVFQQISTMLGEVI